MWEFVKNASWCSVQCTGILLVHENNTWQNSTANEGFESVGRGCLDLAGVAKILATLLSTGAFATDERGMARVLMHPPARTLERSSHELCFFCPTTPPGPAADRPATRILSHPTVAAHILTATQPTRRNSCKHGDISYKQWQKSYKIPDFHTNMTNFITFKWSTRC